MIKVTKQQATTTQTSVSALTLIYFSGAK